MTLDRLTAPDDVAFDSRHHCDRCGDHVPVLIRLCGYCATPPRTETPKENPMTDQPDPRFPGVPPEQIGDTLLLPDYCVESACIPQTSGSDAHGEGEAPSAAPSSEPETPTKQKRKSSAAVLLMAEHGVEASDVRSWATQAGIPVAGRGGLPVDLVEQYLAQRNAA